jgi:hypothetical protein
MPVTENPARLFGAWLCHDTCTSQPVVNFGPKSQTQAMERGRIFGVALTPMLCAQNSAYAPGNSSIPQAIVAYGYLRWDYLELDRLLASIPKVGLASDLISLDKSLDSLHCDVPKRMAPPHKVLILPPFPITRLLRPWPKGRRVNELVPFTKVEIDCRP